MTQQRAFPISFFLLFLLSLEAYSATVPKQYRLGFSAAYTSISYTESDEFQPSRGVSGFSEIALTTKASLRYFLIPPVVDLEANVFFTALPLSTNLSGVTVRYLGANVRLGVPIPPILPKPLSLNLMLGWYYITMFVTDNQFGFQNIRGPQIYPELSWIIHLKNDLPLVFTTYFKFSPISTSLTTLTFKNRELSTGLNVRIPVGGANVLPYYAYMKALSIGVNYTTINPEIQALRLVTIKNSTTTVYLGYDF